MTYSMVNGDLVTPENAVIPVQDRGFRYGDGVFETIAVHQGVPYQFEWHTSRLNAGLAALKIAFDTAMLQQHCRQLLAKNQLGEGFLRIQVTRGSGSQGYLPTGGNATCVIETSLPSVVGEAPVSLWHSRQQKIANTPPIKSCQGLNSTLTRMEAVEQQCFDALLLNQHGHLCETSSANLFWLENGVLYTPALRCGIVEGSTRAAILRLSPFRVAETEATIDDLWRAEAVFITNVSWLAVGASALQPQNIRWDSAGLARQFRALLQQDRSQYTLDHKTHW